MPPLLIDLTLKRFGVCSCRGQVRLVHGSGATGLQLVQSYSDSDEDSDGAWEGRLGDRYNPPGNLRVYPGIFRKAALRLLGLL